MAKSAREVMEKWSRNLAGSAESMKSGINAVTESPGQRAAEAIDAYEAGVLRALQTGKTRRRMAEVTLEGWKKAALDKGVQRAVAAARDDTARSHELQFLEQFLPYAETVKETVRRMPKGSLQDSIARATKAIEMMSEFEFSRSR